MRKFHKKLNPNNCWTRKMVVCIRTAYQESLICRVVIEDKSVKQKRKQLPHSERVQKEKNTLNI